MMTDDTNSCKKCAELEIILNEKDCEIQRLEVQIKNLKTFLCDYETQAKLCQICSVIDILNSDTIDKPDVCISQAEFNNKESSEANSDMPNSQSSRESITLTDDNNENLHCSKNLNGSFRCRFLFLIFLFAVRFNHLDLLDIIMSNSKVAFSNYEIVINSFLLCL